MYSVTGDRVGLHPSKGGKGGWVFLEVRSSRARTFIVGSNANSSTCPHALPADKPCIPPDECASLKRAVEGSIKAAPTRRLLACKNSMDTPRIAAHADTTRYSAPSHAQ